MVKYKTYDDYKDIESVFLEKIPSHWQVKPLYSLTDFEQGKAHEPFIDEEGEFICVNARFVSTQGKSFKRCTTNLTPAKLNDILMVMSDLPNGRALARAFFVNSLDKYAVNQRVCSITAKSVKAKYLYYQLDRSPYFLMFDDGSNQTHLSNNTYKKYPVLLPTEDEQEKISSFLDHETAKIDTLIEKQQRLIELLTEKRQAVISHAVTKGLNPDVPMKDSGVEWLGEVPSSWRHTYLSIVADVIDPQPDHRAPAISEDGEGFPYIGIRDVKKDGTLNFETARPVNESAVLKQEKSFSIDAEDIIFCKVGTLGLPRKIRPHGRCALSATLVLIKPKLLVDSQFLLYVLDSDSVISQTNLLATGSTRAALGIQQIRRFKIPYPKLDEQKKIANFLDNEVAKIDSLIEMGDKQIQLMQERRTALISAAVTGKIDVRDWVKPE